VRNFKPVKRTTKEFQTYATHAHRLLHARSVWRGIFLTPIDAQMEERKLERFQMQLFGFRVASK